MNRNFFLFLSLGLLIAGCSQKEDKPVSPATNGATPASQSASSPIPSLTTNISSAVSQMASNIPTAAISQAASNATATVSGATSNVTAAASSAMASGKDALGKLGQFGRTPPVIASTNPVLESPKAASAPLPTTATLPASGLPTDQITSALKEALGKGLQHAVASLGTQDGFLSNVNVKIPVPEKLQPVEKALRSFGQGKIVDDFDTTINRAAEQAVPAAADVFSSTLEGMSMTDVKTILNGTNDAATQYFRKATETQLTQKFLPIVQQATAKSGATAAYEKLMTEARVAGPFLDLPSFDLDNYVTGKALDGLFTMVADEEKKIRENPAAQGSQLLKSVFGMIGK